MASTDVRRARPLRGLRWLPPALLVVLAGACGSAGASPGATGHRSTTTSAGSSARADTATSTTLAPGSPSTSAPAGRSTGGTSGPQPGSSTTTTAAATPEPAAAGHYTYRQSGTETVAGNTQNVPAQGTDLLDPPSSTGPTSWTQTTHEYIDDSQPPTDSVYEISPKGWALETEVFRYAYGGSTVTFNCQFSPPLPVVDWPPTVGYSFSGSGNCGSFTVSVSGKISARQQSQIGTTSVTSWVLGLHFTTQGQLTSTTSLTAWFAPSLGVDVHESQQSQGSYSFFKFSTNTVRDLVSTKPS